MNRVVAGAIAGFALAIAASPAAALSLVLSGSELQGANGVIVNGIEYNVRFADGTCAGLYSGCDSVADFVFTTEADALAASQALLDQIFIPANGSFDADPEHTEGCESTVNCSMVTPYGFLDPTTVLYYSAVNQADADIDGTGATTDGINSPTGTLDGAVIAVWELVGPVDVPEPHALGAVLLGAAAAAAARRRRTRT
jgi:hypothetical protein